MIQKTLTFSLNQEDVAKYIKRADTPALSFLIGEIKERNEALTDEANKALNKKHFKKITKGYLHCPVYYSADEIAKKQLQELIYQHGVETIVSTFESTDHRTEF